MKEQRTVIPRFTRTSFNKICKYGHIAKANKTNHLVSKKTTMCNSYHLLTQLATKIYSFELFNAPSLYKQDLIHTIAPVSAPINVNYSITGSDE